MISRFLGTSVVLGIVLSLGCLGAGSRDVPDTGNPPDDGIPGDSSGHGDFHETAFDPEDLPRDSHVREVDEGSPLTCRTCKNDTDCRDGYLCLAVGSAASCLMECETANDCPPGFICYLGSAAGHACLPISYNCVPCIHDAPCESGMCCDFVTGECKDCREQCQTCAYDFDCREGHRCLKEGASPMGVCVAGCRGEAACPEGFTCGVNAAGVDVCLPDNPDECRGCPAGSHIRGDGTCVQCLNSSHCDQGEVCNPFLNRCVGECGMRMKCDDGQCHDCCDDSDCPEAGGSDTGPCLDGRCVNAVVDCSPFCHDSSGCIMVDGNPVCPVCHRDEDCPHPECRCSGSPLFACFFEDGGICAVQCPATCASGADCPVLASGQMPACYLGGGNSGICFDPSGSCDLSSSCCAPGQTCLDFDPVVSAFALLGMSLQTGLISGACTCSDALPCLGGGVCTPTSSLCDLEQAGPILCQGGTPPSWLPAALCVDLAPMIMPAAP